MLFPSPSAWKMVKYSHDNIPENMIGWDQTSHEIHKDDISMYSWYF